MKIESGKVEKNLNTKEINALIYLLDDNDKEIFATVSEKIMELGNPIIPALENAWETSSDLNFQEKLENLIQEIQYRSVSHDLYNWCLTGATDLLNGAVIVAQSKYPDLQLNQIINTLSPIKQDIMLELHDNLPPYEKIKIMNYVFFKIYKFSGNYSNYFTPQNYYLNQVIELKKGNPVTLGILYLTLARWCNIPLYGVNLPKNFIVAYKNLNAKKKKDSVLFYINPYNKGSILKREEIDAFLDQQNIKPDDNYYYPCDNFEIIGRLIKNLINSYETTGNNEYTYKLKRLLSIVVSKGHSETYFENG
jgi:regulator of sirC expression with transglutaminase-like and TPR domain